MPSARSPDASSRSATVAAPAVIALDHVTKQFEGKRRVVALDDVTLTIAAGDMVSIIGPSGSGKSTLLRCVNLLEVPTAGDVFVDGVHVNGRKVELNTVRADVGMVFQSFNLFPHLSALENITLAQRRVRKRSKRAAEATARAQLERVGIPEKARRITRSPSSTSPVSTKPKRL